jgi:hypothetical protein
MGFLASPTPCSPVMTPPKARTPEKSSSSAASRAARVAGSGFVHHDIHVDIPVARVPEAGHGEAVAPLNPRPQSEEILQAASRHHHVLIHLREARVTQSIGEFPPQLPESLGVFRPVRPLNKARLGLLQQPVQGLEFASDRCLVARPIRRSIRRHNLPGAGHRCASARALKVNRSATSTAHGKKAGGEDLPDGGPQPRPWWGDRRPGTRATAGAE